MLVRIRSKNGTARYEVQPSDDASILVSKILSDAPDGDPSTFTLSQQPRGGEQPLSSLSGTLESLGLKHGDLLFVGYKDREANGVDPQSNGVHIQPVQSSSTSATSSKKPWETVKEDPVDVFWEAQDGKIPRKRDRMCRHGDKSMCDHCMPLEPYDATYQAEHKIKHLSFHSYLRKRDIATNKTTGSSANTFIPPLSEPNYHVQVPCPSGSHPSWPAGICTKCQPSAVTLSLQQYRLVDHVEFASPDIVDTVIDFWRKTSQQRFGWLLGRYETYTEVPMGVKAVVEAVHEPPQEGDVDGIRLGLPWEDEEKVEELAAQCGLRIVGMVFTDLTRSDDDELARQGKVLAKRHKDAYFLSSLEAIWTAKQARRRPNSSRFSDSGKFSSKFVTCVITGDLDGNISVQAYQVSDQAIAMVDADMVEASVDPAVVRIREVNTEETDLSKKRYIPDVFYTYKNEYKLEVKESAKPCFPTDYLLVSLTHGFPTAPNPLFLAPSSTAFPVENRQGLHDQTMVKVAAQVNKLVKALPSTESIAQSSSAKGKGRASDQDAIENVARWLSDWHLLAFLNSIFDKADMALLCRVGISRDQAAVEALLQSSAWQTMLAIATEHEDKDASRFAELGSFETGPDGFPIIPEDHDMMKGDTTMQNASKDFQDIPDIDIPPDTVGGGGSAGGNAAGVIVCPHCTFENAPGSIDCDICSLPLQG